MKATLSILTILFFTFSCLAEEKPDWSIHGYGPYHHKDEADGISIDSKGNTFIAGGFSKTFFLAGKKLVSKGKRDIFYAKFSPRGRLVWVKTIATELDENIYDMTIDRADNLILNGEQQIKRNGKINYAAVTYKLNKRGGQLWKKTFTSSHAAGGNEITTDGNGNIYATYISMGSFNYGRKSVSPGKQKNSHILKISPRGRIKWAVHTSGRGPERTRAIATAYNGTRIVVGFEYRGEIKVRGKSFIPSSQNTKQGAFVILDQFGNIKKFDAIKGSRHSNIRGAGGYDDGIYLYGTFQGKSKLNNKTLFPIGSRDSFLMKINQRGGNKWMRVLGNSSTEDGGEIAVDKRGNALITGDHRGGNYQMFYNKWFGVNLCAPTSNRSSAHLFKISPMGFLLNTYCAEKTRGQSASGVVETKDGKTSVGIRIYGEFKADNKTYKTVNKDDKDFVIMKFDF